MNDQASLFERVPVSVERYRAGVIRAVTDAGQERALQAEDPVWIEQARAVLERFAASGESFTADDLRAVVGDPVRPNSLSALFGAASHARHIRCVGVRTSKRISRHGGIQRLWVGDGHAA